MRGSFAADVVQDQISASHPYGAFVVPYMAEDAGIYHTNPKAVYIPDDPRFGKYREDFANTVCLYEERPSRNWKDAAHFGNSKKIVNTTKVLEKLQDDNDNRVDQEFVLRNRLFDLFIADWDRHEDQWRWASFKEKKGTMYRPIPRDRDQAFFVNQGRIPRIASRKWAMPKFQGFDHDLKNVPGFMFNARYFDRSFLNGLERQDWLNMAEQLKTRLTDSSIESAINQWPDSVYQLTGQEVSDKLKSRRDKLTDFAISHYEFLAREVDVVGSDKRERFELERKDGGQSVLKVYKLKKDGTNGKELYSRTFYRKETKEIRLYGLGGKDDFRVFGQADKAIKTRIIGGDGKDHFSDESKVRGFARKTLVYDTRKGNSIEKGREIKKLTSNRPDVNAYDRRAFKYNLTMPLAIAAFNPDDGVFLGAGVLRTTHGFRKSPYKSRHLLIGRIALATGAFDFRYDGIWNEVIGPFDLRATIDVEGPNYALNYFGYGNESVYNQENGIDYYRVRFDNVLSRIMLRKRFGENLQISAGPNFENINVRGKRWPFHRGRDHWRRYHVSGTAFLRNLCPGCF